MTKRTIRKLSMLAAFACMAFASLAGGASAAPGEGPVCDPCGVPIGQFEAIAKRLESLPVGSPQAADALKRTAKFLRCVAADTGQSDDPAGDGKDSRQYQTISNVLKTRHDTVKNCIQNAR